MSMSMRRELRSEYQTLYEDLKKFVRNDCIPAENLLEQQLNNSTNRWKNPQILEDLKEKAKELGLWNAFIRPSHAEFGGPGLTEYEYAIFCEEMGRSFIAPEACNCSAPDTGNMEVLMKYGTKEQQQKWLPKLLDGSWRSAFLMTEPEVASSDALNICSTIERQGDEYVINGHKWWSSGAPGEECKVAIFLGLMQGAEWESRDSHMRHSMVIVPMDAPGVTKVRPIKVFGYDHAPHGHGEVLLQNVRVPAENIILGEGRGFEIAQGRLGPGRVHHCMRSIGMAERALEAAVLRCTQRKTFGVPLSHHGALQRDLAEARMSLTQARLLVLYCAEALDRSNSVKEVIQEIAMIKVVVPNMACKIIDMAIQIHGGAGVSQDFFLAEAYAWMRTLRIADGPDDVHIRSIVALEFRRIGHRINQRRGNSRENITERSKL